LSAIPAAASSEFAAVISSGHIPVFAKLKLSPRQNRRPVVLFVLTASLLVLYPSGSSADSMEDAAKELARKVCAPPRPSSLDVRWQDEDVSAGIISDSVKKAFLSQLSACGIDASKSSGVPILTVTARVTPSNVLLTADSGSSTETRRVFMVEIPRAAVPLSNESSLAPHLRKELLWQQERPIDSAVEWHDDSTKQSYLLLLSEGFLVRLRFENNAWTLADSTELPKPERRSRGGNGTFVSGYPDTKLAVLFFRELCRFEPTDRPLFRCAENYLGGKIVEIVSLCDQTKQVLWTGRGDHTQNDRIIPAGTPDNQIPSKSVEVPGPVLDISNGDDPKTATAVVRNLSTGNYELYRITAVCGN
jgi:hypothetical protein